MADQPLPQYPFGQDANFPASYNVNDVVSALAAIPQKAKEAAAPVGSFLSGMNEMLGASTYTRPKDIKAVREAYVPKAADQFLESTLNSPAANDALSVTGGLPSANLGIFLGGKGVRALEQQTGKLLPEHPAAVANMRFGNPMIEDQGMRERWAESLLKMRSAAGQPDTGIFEQSGWSLGADGKPRREVPDIGAKLEPVWGNDLSTGEFDYQKRGPEGGLLFRWNHPAGDLHSIYNVPDILVQGRGTGGGASFNPSTRQITINADPYTKAGMDYANKVIPHEFQHPIQETEGFDLGGNPAQMPFYQQYWDARKAAGRNANESILDARNREKVGNEIGVGYSKEALDTYRRLMGEVEANNAVTRRGSSYNYLLHPSATESVPRSQQLVSYSSDAWPHSWPRYVDPSTGADVSSMVNALLSPQK